MHPAVEIVNMIQDEREEQARRWRDIPDADFPLRKSIDFKLEGFQKRIREMYPAEFPSEQGSTDASSA